MDQVFDYTIPVLHPLVIHLPLAFLPASAVLLLGWLVRDRASWLLLGVWSQLVGTAGAAAAVRTGEAMADQSEGVPIVERLVPVHESWGEATAWAAVALTALLVATWIWNRRATDRPGVPLPWRLALAVLGIAVASMALWTGHVGGVMVWGVLK